MRDAASDAAMRHGTAESTRGRGLRPAAVHQTPQPRAT